MTQASVSVNLSDHELVTRAQGGDAAAFEALVHRHDRQVLAIAASFTRDPDDAKDIYQDVFIRVYRALPGFEFRSEFSTWLHRITTNVCLTHQTRRKRHATVSIEPHDERALETAEASASLKVRPISPERYAQSREIAAHVERALEHLSPRQRMVFTLKHYEGYKLREIADMMECSEGTVKKYLFTATNKLRDRLKRYF